MKVYEYLAKDIFRKNGIPVPNGQVALNPEEAEKIAQEIGKPLALKSQVLVGGRGKAGGIKFADHPSQVKELANQL
ncbi:MAG TPA: ATP-grasp domain-containing protein, partial [Methanobacterium sp.]|nr:ATP-grasp domain-containing protein [Methanobacterium sp.]